MEFVKIRLRDGSPGLMAAGDPRIGTDAFPLWKDDDGVTGWEEPGVEAVATPLAGEPESAPEDSVALPAPPHNDISAYDVPVKRGRGRPRRT